MRIARSADGQTTTLRLIGRIRSGDIQEIRDQMDVPRRHLVCDLSEVTLVDLDTVHFLGSCELEGVKLVDCAHYIRDWISRERNVSIGQAKSEGE